VECGFMCALPGKALNGSGNGALGPYADRIDATINYGSFRDTISDCRDDIMEKLHPRQ